MGVLSLCQGQHQFHGTSPSVRAGNAMPGMAMQHAECSRDTVPRACLHVHGGAGPTLRLDFQSASHACACQAWISWPRAPGHWVDVQLVSSWGIFTDSQCSLQEQKLKG